ncbi:hypothetical protein FRC19_003191 [Serendipita sp. 401]|nr:hypothetical protein FRC19_003191 [Serendipita sp. 401]KAG9055315.1 hypothetical protein FS842_002524 [Serendipita sp. 407]
MQTVINDGRGWLRQLFRTPPLNETTPDELLLNNPHVAWLEVEPITGFSFTPPRGILVPPVSGVHARFVVNPSTNDVYALVSLGGRSMRIPPYPGPIPPAFDSYNHPLFYDASLGPHEARRYAQEWQTPRPWFAFHTIHQESEPENRPIEHWDAADFCNSTSMREDDLTGSVWKVDKIKLLLDRREKAETFLWTNGLLADPENVVALHTTYASSLPFFDNFDIQQVASWNSEMDGAATIGETLRYVSEVLAIGRWLVEVRRQKTSPRPSSSPPKRYMGVWAGSIASAEDWTFILNASLPIYGLFLVPPEHPIYAATLNSGATSSFDGDESYRLDAFTSSLPFSWAQGNPCVASMHSDRHVYYEKGHQSVRYNHLLPLSFQHFHPPGDAFVPSGGIPTNAPHLPWNAYIFEDRSIYRSVYTGTKHAEVSQQTAATNWERMIAIMQRHRPPVDEVIHPATRFIELRDPTMVTKRYFREHNKGYFFWIQPLEIDEAVELCNDWPGYFHRVNYNDILLSDWPWPVVGDTFPFFEPNYVSSTEAVQRIADNRHRRVYLHDEPGDDMIPVGQLGLRPPPVIGDFARLAGPVVGGEPRTYWLRSASNQINNHTPWVLPLDTHDSGNEPKHSIARFISNFRSDSESRASVFNRDLGDDTIPITTGTESSGQDYSYRDVIVNRLMEQEWDNPVDPSFFEIDPSTSSLLMLDDINEVLKACPDALLDLNHLENHRVGMEFLINLALGNVTPHDTSLTTSFLDGPVTPNQIFQMIEAKKMWLDVWDARDRVGSTEPSSPSLGDVEPMDVCYSTASIETEDDQLLNAYLENLDDLLEPTPEVDIDVETDQDTTDIQDAETIPDSATEISGQSESVLYRLGLDPEDTDTVHEVATEISDHSEESGLSILIREHRARAQAYLDNRLNLPVAPNADIADQVVAASFVHPLDGIATVCYPMRVYNVFIPARTSESIAHAFHQYALDTDMGDVVLISTHVEADGLATVDIAFRFAEDALNLWAHNGHYFGGHYWRVLPLKHIGSQVTIFPTSSTLRSLDDRKHRLWRAFQREADAGDNNVDICVEQILELFSRLDDESQVNSLAIGNDAPSGIQESPILIKRPIEWSLWGGDGVLGPWMKYWSVGPDQMPAPVNLEMSGAERNQAYRDSFHTAHRKYKLWSSSGINLPTPPNRRIIGKQPPNATKSTDPISIPRNYLGFLDLWNWYRACEKVLLQFQHNSLPGGPQHLNQLPVPSTAEDRRTAVQYMSFNALREVFSPSELLRCLRGDMLTAVSRIIAASAQ